MKPPAPVTLQGRLVRLEPLTEDELAPLGIDGLHAATGGNPRFVAEASRCGRQAEPSRTLLEALVAQCRAEGAWGCRVLTAASVLDQPFDPEPLAALLETDAAELTEELERLCERHILRIDGLRFRFRYDLVRRALFASVSPARRRLLLASTLQGTSIILSPLIDARSDAARAASARLGFRGVVAKRAGSAYRPNALTSDWVKITFALSGGLFARRQLSSPNAGYANAGPSRL